MRFLPDIEAHCRPTPPRALLGATLAILVLLFALPGSAVAVDPITYRIDGISGSNGWYRGSSLGNLVRVFWTYNVDVLQGCTNPSKVDGPTTGTRASCTVILTNGQPLTWYTAPIKIDRDPPTGVAASLSRGPDFNGWYNHPLGVAWRGGDATSGIASCSVLTYSGPDRAGARIGGGCTDRAGNGASTAIAINYDATAPVLNKVSITSKAGSDLVHWKSTSPSDTVVLQRWTRGTKEPAAGKGVVFRGTGETFTDTKIRSSLEYTYAVQTFDQAGNASRKISVLAFPKVLTLGKTPYTPRAASSPILRWDRSRGAKYYHVQLFRGSKRILAAWPLSHQLKLRSAWKWSGHRYRLAPGRYRWYVWAGIGKRSFARYRTIGSAQFIVPR
jgi:hypothetical protein